MLLSNHCIMEVTQVINTALLSQIHYSECENNKPVPLVLAYIPSHKPR